MIGHANGHTAVNLDCAAIIILEDGNAADALWRNILKGIPCGGISALDEAIALGLLYAKVSQKKVSILAILPY